MDSVSSTSLKVLYLIAATTSLAGCSDRQFEPSMWDRAGIYDGFYNDQQTQGKVRHLSLSGSMN